MSQPLLRVAAAIIERPDGHVLLAQRPAGKAYAGYWEFPGGKLEAGETPRDAEARHHEAVQFALQRGSRSGRVAWQFARSYAGAAGLRGKKRNA